MLDFKGRRAVVTGGSRGIGRAIARKLAAQGADVIITYVGNDAAADEALTLIHEVNPDGKALKVKGDIADPEFSKEVAKLAKSEFGGLDILVNNAGITNDKLLLRMKPDDFTSVINTNLNGAFYMLSALAPLMTKGKYGRIINISSVAGVKGNPGQVNYASSKAGLIGMTLSAAKELGSRNITVNAVAPGFIQTDMTNVLTEEQKEASVAAITLKRMGQPDDIANTVAFLASEEGGYITGQVLSVDGGIQM
ncbi:MAG: 3-oxoacyl-[acyl-carrier-protein] reductase [Clostridiales Family XIII bacterium]|jgi:3-oxoacyl-[acyl-carrier protein] reductase|nr:3-oxoacyl-[acyl-carrier-protein] reductase [Clostridiales Family XIII bacterium]